MRLPGGTWYGHRTFYQSTWYTYTYYRKHSFYTAIAQSHDIASTSNIVPTSNPHPSKTNATNTIYLITISVAVLLLLLRQTHEGAVQNNNDRCTLYQTSNNLIHMYYLSWIDRRSNHQRQWHCHIYTQPTTILRYKWFKIWITMIIIAAISIVMVRIIID